MFRFTDKEDSVGVGVYDVILKYDRGRYMLTMGRKQEPLCKKLNLKISKWKNELFCSPLSLKGRKHFTR